MARTRKPRRSPGAPSVRAVEVRYRAMLLRRVRALDRLVMREVLPALDPLDMSSAGAVFTGSGDERVLRVDAIAEALTLVGLLRTAFARVNPFDPTRLVALASTIDGRLSKVFGGAIVGVPNQLDIGGWVDENVSLIWSIEGRYQDQVADIIEVSQRGGVSTRDTRKLIQARTGVAKSRARLIARDQIGSANAKITRQRQTEAGVSHYIWRTSKDDKVRDEHADREGDMFAWNNPPHDGHPGEPIQCRCTAEPVLGALVRR